MDLPQDWAETPGRPLAQRSGIVDLGSNSIRLVVFEGRGRNPQAIFNEKAVLGLGRGLQASGRLNEEAVEQTLTVILRYRAIARAMRADPLEVLATAAVRDASNGPAFIAALQERLVDVPIQVLSGEAEAAYSADGVLLGFPAADGVLGDLGGGSLEVVELSAGLAGRSASLGLGTIRLGERAGGDVARARAIADADLATLPWLGKGAGRDLFLVGGAWRALARMHIAQTAYPLQIVHHYTLKREEARDLCDVVMAATRRMLERLPGAQAKRVTDLPFAAVALRRMLRATGAKRVVFSANGLREGWYARALPAKTRGEDPMLAAARHLGLRLGRDARLPEALFGWTAPLFDEEPPAIAALRLAACWFSDTGSHDHPDYRAEQAFLRVLRQPSVGLDHHARAFLALVVALRYEANSDAQYIATARLLLDVAWIRRAEVLGAALRLAFTLSGGTPELLGGTTLRRRGGRLVLRLIEGSGVFAGESVVRRMDSLAATLGLETVVEVSNP